MCKYFSRICISICANTLCGQCTFLKSRHIFNTGKQADCIRDHKDLHDNEQTLTLTDDDEVDDKATALLHSAIDDAKTSHSIHQYRNVV